MHAEKKTMVATADIDGLAKLARGNLQINAPTNRILTREQFLAMISNGQIGIRVREIGPLPIKPNENYTAQFMEGILEPGAVSGTNVHSGPEAFYTESGESCLETPAGFQVGPKAIDLVIPEGTPMELVASGKETRRGIILVLHSSERPATTVTNDWKSKGLCFGDH